MRNPLRLFIIIFSALAFLTVLSVCPWSKWTGGRLKDFNLLGDVLPATHTYDNATSDNLDPELVALLSEPQTDTVSEHAEKADTLPPVPYDFIAPVRDGSVLIEDYDPYGKGITRLSDILSQSGNRKVRIAMVGDSYIEGDILAQDIRAGLQERFGGSGVGYIGAFSQFPGFRGSVNQSCSGWEETEIRKMEASDPLRTILGHYHTAGEGAMTRYKGSAKPAHVTSWTSTTVLFKSASQGTITLSGSDTQARSFPVGASDDLQAVSLDAPTADISITTDVPDLKVLGVWLEGNAGIVLDDISLRGNSGLSHRRLDATTTAQMRRWIDYDVIILEFGLNVVSVEQTDYTAYGRAMTDVVNNIKTLYPQAVILLLGVGDRAIKQGTQYLSMPTLPALIKAQRETARITGSLFYDTRAAMGGDGAAVDWHARKLVNADYVHLNHHGGKELADIFLKSLYTTLQ